MHEVIEKINNAGGPAFPATLELGPQKQDEGTSVTWTGMSLRDYFAAKAMAAELISTHMLPEAIDAFTEAQARAGRTPEQHLAFNAYSIADAMLAEREKGGAK